MLEVVEHQQHGAAPQVGLQAVPRAMVVVAADVEGLDHHCRDEPRVSHGAERHEGRAIGKGWRQQVRHAQGEPRFAYPAGTGQGDQPHVIALQQVRERGDLRLPAHKEREGRRQAGSCGGWSREGKQRQRGARIDILAACELPAIPCERLAGDAEAAAITLRAHLACLDRAAQCAHAHAKMGRRFTRGKP
jgi:hypothetical protein